MYADAELMTSASESDGTAVHPARHQAQADACHIGTTGKRPAPIIPSSGGLGLLVAGGNVIFFNFYERMIHKRSYLWQIRNRNPFYL